MDLLKHRRTLRSQKAQHKSPYSSSLLAIPLEAKNAPIMTYALYAILLTMITGISTLPLGLPTTIPPALAATLFLCGAFIAWIGAYLFDQHSFTTMANGMRIIGAISGVAGFSLLGATTEAMLRASLLASLFLSTISGLLCFATWKEILLRHHDLPQKRFWTRLILGIQVLYGIWTLGVILIPLLLPWLLTLAVPFMGIRLIPISLSIGVAVALMERTHNNTPADMLGKRVAWLGLATQSALLIGTNPFSPVWGLALFLLTLQIIITSHWIFAYQLAQSRATRSQAAYLVAELDRATSQLVEQEQRFAARHHEYASWLALAAHDIILPLQTILMGTSGIVQQAQKQGNTAAILTQAYAIQSASNRFKRFVTLFLDSASQTLETPLTLNLRPLPVTSLIAKVIADEQILVPGMITLMTTPPPDVDGQPLAEDLLAIWDKERIEAVILNFLQNAEKYSPAGSPPIEVYLWQHEHSNGIVITIIDHGRGMSAETLEHLFEPHYRGEGAEKIEGRGLGLAIAKQIIEIHHGNVTVQSTLGVGSTVTLLLPPVSPEGYAASLFADFRRPESVAETAS